MEYATVVEGGTRLRVPVADRLLKSNEVFYNPEMQLSRDITVAALKVLKPVDYCDLLSASGARGVRAVVEAGIPAVINDLNPSAVKLAEDNLSLNGVEAEVTRLDARQLLAGRRFSFIDVDPFGPPVGFMDSVFQSIVDRGFVAFTATDTSALSGTYPRACRRKYDAQPLRSDCYNEVGLRILVGFAARTALRHGFGVRVLFSHSTRHYMRSIIQVSRRGGVVDGTLKSMMYLQHCFKCLERGYLGWGDSVCSCGGAGFAGPLWAGATADESLCERVMEELLACEYATKRDAVGIVGLVSGEQGVFKPYYDVHKVASNAGVSVPRRDVIFERLEEAGFKSFRTHYNMNGVKTEGTVNDLKGVLK
ncbi:MAG: tRNA (guanine(10)-N(2))-dimethyltransferase [Candidatus Altiarchaeota archaeon]